MSLCIGLVSSKSRSRDDLKGRPPGFSLSAPSDLPSQSTHTLLASSAPRPGTVRCSRKHKGQDSKPHEGSELEFYTLAAGYTLDASYYFLHKSFCFM